MILIKDYLIKMMMSSKDAENKFFAKHGWQMNEYDSGNTLKKI